MSVGKHLARGLWSEMPVLRVGIGLCPALAVSRTLQDGVAMAAATVAVLLGACVVVPPAERAVPGAVRFWCRMAVVAGLVTGVELVMSRYWPRLRADLGIFVPLMAANCMVMGSLGGLDGQGRAATALVGLGRGIGFAVALTVLSFLREVAGSGTLWGRHVFGQAVAGVPFAALPAGAFVTAGFLAGLVGLLQARRARRT